MPDRLSLVVLPSPSTMDHEVRILVNGEDWLGPRHLGLDPPALRAELLATSQGPAQVGRCECGCHGCDDIVVTIERDGSRVRWGGGPQPAAFDSALYDAELARFAEDHSWEDLGRRVERHVETVLDGAVLPTGERFDWASARITPAVLRLSFRGERQRFLDLPWDGLKVDDAVAAAQALRKRLDQGA